MKKTILYILSIAFSKSVSMIDVSGIAGVVFGVSTCAKADGKKTPESKATRRLSLIIIIINVLLKKSENVGL